MEFSLGLDIGGTKIAGAVFDEQGHIFAEEKILTPKDYDSFMKACVYIVNQLNDKGVAISSTGISITGLIDKKEGRVMAYNLPFLLDKPFRDDLETLLSTPIQISNDANCAALAEAMEGAGKNYKHVFYLIVGTGVGGALVYNHQLIEGASGLAGEVGHLPLPFRQEDERSTKLCGCGQRDCIEQAISGPALESLYFQKTNISRTVPEIVDLAAQDDSAACEIMEKYYTLFARAMTTIIHSFDPEIIVVSGGLSNVKMLYTQVPIRWRHYVINHNPKTLLMPAAFGPIAGLRGAALLGKVASV